VGNAPGLFQVEAELWYQPIAYCWAQNLPRYNAFETERFTGYFDAMFQSSGIMLVRATSTI